METQPTTAAISVPWNTRDVWYGIVTLAGLILLFVGGSLLLKVNQARFGYDEWINLTFFIQELFNIVPVLWFALHQYHSGWSSLGLRKFTRQNLNLGCGLTLLTYVIIIIYAMILTPFHLKMQTSVLPVFNNLSSPWFFLVFGAFVAPFTEELFFRGFVFAGLQTRYDWKIAAAISSLLFAIAHLELTFLLPAFLLGFLFAYLYHRSHSIWPGIIMHVSINTFGLGMALLLRMIPT
jgi:Predicted metal-dependent membrane protease